MYRAVRAHVRGVREPSLEERREIAESTPETRAYLTVQLAERQHGGERMPSWAIRKIEAEARAYADALGKLAAERARVETRESTGQNGLGFSLEQLAEEADQAEREGPRAIAPLPAPALAPAFHPYPLLARGPSR